MRCARSAGSYLALCAALWLGACDGRAAPPEELLGVAGETRGTALPEDLERQAWDALARDAWLRDARFREALAPGTRFAATRIQQSDVEAGRYGAEALFRIGQTLFELRVDASLGAGGADLPALARVHRGRRGGPDARHCAACHRRGGVAGAGDAADVAFYDGDGETPASALARDAPALVGAGALELVGRERTRALLELRDATVAEARRRGAPVRTRLEVDGVSFGVLEARADGTLDASGVRGVAPDLVVRPFGRTGRHAGLREVVEEELVLHLGLETSRLATTGPPEVVGPAGGTDPDGDGVVDEITEGQLTALVLYVAMQEIPTLAIPASSDAVLRAGRGRARFDDLGCADCHSPALSLRDPQYVLASRAGGADVVVDLSAEAAQPRLDRDAEGAGPFTIHAYTDLRRHDVGAELSDARPRDGTTGSVFMTPPLWGLSRSGPYLHDGRAPTVEDAILLHGGEAQAARDGYAALDDAARGELRVFLATLTRSPRVEAR